ncbi:MAG TPA: thioredoxin family protein [Candidatus Acidoferrales bacterium]|nr:thioredoxin family protein [Candidatus Acidoferrales bacterium]
MKQLLFFLFLVAMTPLIGCSDEGVGMGKTVTDTNAMPVNLAAEVTKAKSEHKLLLLEFGSSDACPPCVRFQQEVFSTPQFEAFAASNLDFVRLDFPLKVDLRPETRATNELLSRQFDQDIFPTFIALDGNGKEFWRIPKNADEDPGFDALFNPTNFINLMEQLKEKE